MNYKITQHSLIAIWLFTICSCATSSATFKADVQFTGEQARINRYGLSQIDINRSYGISLFSNCAEIVHKGTMTSPLIALPPVLPTGNKVEHLAAKRPFKIILESAHNLAVNYKTVRIVMTHSGKTHLLPFSRNPPQKKTHGKQYEYRSPYHCSDIKDATLRVIGLQIAGSPTPVKEHTMTFHEGTEWTSN